MGKKDHNSRRSSSSRRSRGSYGGYGGYGGRSHNFGYGQVHRAGGYGKHGRKLGGYGPHGVVGPSGPTTGFSIGSRSRGISGRFGRFDVGAGRGATGLRGAGARGAAGARVAAARGPAAGPVRFGRGGTTLRSLS